MNSKHITIIYEIELPDNDGFLPILGTRMKINQNGTIERKLFLHQVSQRRYRVELWLTPLKCNQTAVLHNYLRRTNICSTTEHQQQAIEATKNKLIKNGYQKSFLDANQKRQVKHRKDKATTPPMFTFSIPFVSDQLNHQIRRTLANWHSNPSCQSPRKNDYKSHSTPWRFARQDLSQQFLPSPRGMPAIKRGLCCDMHTLRRVLCRNDDTEVARPLQGTRAVS